jgi:hypothetical protein
VEEQSFQNRKRSNFLMKNIANPKERKKIVFTLGIVVILFLIGLLFVSYFYQQWLSANVRAYKGTFKELGSISQIGFFATLSIFPVFLMLKWKFIKKIGWRKFQLKSLLQFIGKIVRQWHAPVAIVSAAIVILHGYMAILKGFEWNFTYLSGIVSVLVLFLLLFLGLKRYKRKDQKWHFRMALCFLIVFMLHATFA